MKEIFVIKRNGRTFHNRENSSNVVFTDAIKDAQEYSTYKEASDKIKEFTESENEDLANSFFQVEKFFRKKTIDEYGPFIISYMVEGSVSGKPGYVMDFRWIGELWEVDTTIEKSKAKEYTKLKEAKDIAEILQQWHELRALTSENKSKVTFAAHVKDLWQGIEGKIQDMVTHKLSVDELPSQKHELKDFTQGNH